MSPGETGGRLSEVIKKAIRDCEITNAEYEEILAVAHEDGFIDSQERRLLQQLQELIENGTVTRVPG